MKNFEGNSGWPTRPLARVPGPAGAEALARHLRCSVLGPGGEDAPVTDLSPFCRAAGASVRESVLSAAAGMQEASLVPVGGDRFAISVDPEPRGGWSRRRSAELNRMVARHRARFRIGHELAHTLVFWRGSDVPRRHLHDSPQQEAFCDTFAGFLLAPPGAARGLAPTVAGLLELQCRFDVSLEVAARVFAYAHPGRGVALWFAAEDDRLHAQWASRPTTRSHLARARRAARRGDQDARWLAARRQLVFVGAVS